jgi:hypothetical protein
MGMSGGGTASATSLRCFLMVLIVHRVGAIEGMICQNPPTDSIANE